MNSNRQASTVFSGRLFDIERLVWMDGAARTITREVVRHPGAVLIIPVLDGDRLVLIRNYRIAVGRAIWEFPAGTLGRGEDPTHAAKRELLEETGYTAQRIEKLGEFYTSPGLGDELMRVFVAEGLTFEGQQLEAGEEIETDIKRRDEVEEMIRKGEMVDGKSIAGLYLLDGLRRTHTGARGGS